MIKRTILVLMLVLAAMSVSVLAQDSDLSTVDPSGVTITYWHQFNGGAQLETMEQFVADFNANNEWGITVEASNQGGYGDLRDLMNAGIISGELPNLVAGYQSDMASYYADGAVVDLNPYFTDATWGYSEEEQADFIQGLLDVNKFADFDDAMLGWPSLLSANVLSVNLSMLAELGFDGTPATVDVFKEVACAAANSELTGAEDAAVQGYPIKPDASNFESFVAGFGGDIFDYENGQYDFLSEESIAALQMYADIYSEGCAYIPDSRFGNTDDFALGWNPMALGSTAGIPFILGGFENSGVEAEWTITTTPVLNEGDSPALNIFLPSLIVVTGTPEEQLATWLFVKYLSTAENQATWTQNTAYLPSRVSVSAQVADIFSEEDPQYPFIIALNNILSNPDVTLYSPPKGLSYNGVRGLMSEAVANVTANGMDVQEAAELLQESANQLIEDLGS